MENIKCKECDKTFKSVDSVRRHRALKHNVSAEDTYIDYVLDGIKPTCKCGCGGETKYLGIKAGYRDYIRGHASRVNNNWGHNSEAIRKSHETQKKMYKSGELTIWNKGLDISDPRVKNNVEKMLSNPERGDNISKALSGVEKSDDHKRKLSETAKIRWSDPKEREKQSHRRMVWMRDNDFTVTSKLEETINSTLITLGLVEGLDYERQHYVREIKSYYDFKIYSTNTLIEVDGDFWHCNPVTEFKEPKYECQFKNLDKDKIKTKWCEDNNNITLLRFWEYDIKNNLNDVIIKLKELI